MALTLGLAQISFKVGDIQHNLQTIQQTIQQALQQGCQLLVFPEQTLTGYPADDLWLRTDIVHASEKALQEIILASTAWPLALVISYPENKNNFLYNAAVVIHQGKILAHYRKQCLPNNTVFDEHRYFHSDDKPSIFSFEGIKIGLIICEDLWCETPVMQAKNAGAEIIITPNASPFEIEKHARRKEVLQQRAMQYQLPIFYVNWADAQDDIILDGDSLIIDHQGKLLGQGRIFKETLLIATINNAHNIQVHCDNINTFSEDHYPERIARIYQALVFATERYVNKNHAQGVLIGVSGGIDSALVLAIAVDAIGQQNVHALILPSRYTSNMSMEDATALTQNFGVAYTVISIEQLHQAFHQTLAADQPLLHDLTDQNAQARLRGLLLMAYANQLGKFVLNTSNKSELAMGYSTLYGDAIGAYAVLKDIDKTTVYELATYRNNVQAQIPARILTRAPSAELKPNQLDEDTLPPYALLDQILKRHVEQGYNADEIIAQSFPADIVHFVMKRLYENEYKRRQAPIGPHITRCSFNRDRRFPLSYRHEK